MEITEVRIFPMEEDKLKAYSTITFDNCFVVRDIKVISGNSGLFVAMPSKKRKDGSFKDIAHPLNNDFRAKIEEAVLEAYQKEQESSEVPEIKKQVFATPVVEAKMPDQINPQDYSAPDE